MVPGIKKGVRMPGVIETTQLAKHFGRTVALDAAGSVTGRRVHATTVGAGVAVVAYALNAVANQNADREPLHGWSR